MSGADEARGASTGTAGVRRLFAGSYTEGAGDRGIYTIAFDEERAVLSVEQAGGHAPNPSFVVVRDGMLYAAHELSGRGCLAAYAVEADGSLACRGACTSPNDAGTCHATLHPNGRCLYGADYESGSIGCCTLAADGSPSGGLPSVRHRGSGADPVRQRSPHVHSTSFVPGTRLLAAVDLGIDAIVLYRADESGALEQPPAGAVPLRAGAGPRMVAYHPRLPLAALACELGNEVVLFRLAGGGLVWERASCWELPAGGRSPLAAHVAFSPDGRFLYASVRGPDRIAVFRVDGCGNASPCGDVASGGAGPRHFSLSPDGRFLAVANMEGDEVRLFALDGRTGMPRSACCLALHRPSCIVWD